MIPEAGPQTSDARSAWTGLLREHPGLLLTAGYLVLTIIGLLYELWFFFYFRINILEYVETSDFLLAALRTPLVILLSLLPVPLAWLLFRLNHWARQKYPRYGAFDSRLENGLFGQSMAGRLASRSLFVLIYAAFFTLLYAERVTDRIKAGHGREVRVELSSGAPFPSRTLLLGTTSKFVFLYLPEAKRTHIVPIENVSRLVVSSEKARPGKT